MVKKSIKTLAIASVLTVAMASQSKILLLWTVRQ
jgi:hypothetical protein